MDSQATLSVSPAHEQLVQAALESKLSAIARYEEISWKIRSGYIVILYGALTLLLGKELGNLRSVAEDFTTSISVLFLILGLSLSAFAVDLSYLRKKIRVVVVRDMLVEVVYDPRCPLRKKLHLLLHVAAERPLKTHFPGAHTKYLSKLQWNLWWILLPIYATTPSLAIVVHLGTRSWRNTASSRTAITLPLVVRPVWCVWHTLQRKRHLKAVFPSPG